MVTVQALILLDALSFTLTTFTFMKKISTQMSQSERNYLIPIYTECTKRLPINANEENPNILVKT